MIARFAEYVVGQAQKAARLASGLALKRKYRDYTMISDSTYATNIDLVHRSKQVLGAVVECGVWRGGMSAGMADVLGRGRKYYLCDSYEGLPPAREIDGPTALAWGKDTDSPYYFDNCSAEVAFAQRAMALSKARDVEYVQGWFSETLPGLTVPGGIAVLRLDADWYDSTMQCLTCLYPQVVPGGLIMIDDYFSWDGCAKAVHDYLSEQKLPDRLRSLGQVCFIQKP